MNNVTLRGQSMRLSLWRPCDWWGWGGGVKLTTKDWAPGWVMYEQQGLASGSNYYYKLLNTTFLFFLIMFGLNVWFKTAKLMHYLSSLCYQPD